MNFPDFEKSSFANFSFTHMYFFLLDYPFLFYISVYRDLCIHSLNNVTKIFEKLKFVCEYYKNCFVYPRFDLSSSKEKNRFISSFRRFAKSQNTRSRLCLSYIRGIYAYM